jgi:hypothetical protein
MAEQSTKPTCELCGEPMPPGEKMFNYHGYSGPCPKPPLPKVDEDIDRVIAQVEEEEAELQMLRNFRNEVQAALASEGPHNVEHLMAVSALGKQTTVIGRRRLEMLREVNADLLTFANRVSEACAFPENEFQRVMRDEARAAIAKAQPT